jgi:cytidylate kinase
MATRIVAISHATGAGGDTIGRNVAERLGFRYIDEEIIARAAAKEGLDSAVVADAERRKSLLERIIADFSQAQLTLADGVGTVWDPEAAWGNPQYELRRIIVEAIHETAMQGDVVIVAHAASIPLAGRDDVLRVLITAALETRVHRVGRDTRRDEASAAKLVRQSDAGRADYFERFYRVERELPTHYDLVINTDKLSEDEAASIVVFAARRSA